MKNEFIEKVLVELVAKARKREADGINTNKRISMKPSRVYPSYNKNTADLEIKRTVNAAVQELIDMGFVTVSKLKYSDEIKMIYLCDEKYSNIEHYLEEERGITTTDNYLNQFYALFNQYKASGEIVDGYIKIVNRELNASTSRRIDYDEVLSNLKMLYFLSNNKIDMYVRECSMLVYGSSKWFKDNNLESVCNIIRGITQRPLDVENVEKNSDILREFHIFPDVQEITLKGNWHICWKNHSLDVSQFEEGISISSKDIYNIKNVYIEGNNIMTIENKTAYNRMSASEFALVYLGGYASKIQLDFLKKVISDNPDVECYHFGDIDIAGLYIREHLCEKLGRKFKMYCMSIGELSDIRFKHCLQQFREEMTPQEKAIAESLIQQNDYKETIEYMIKNDVKLEQEIVCFYLMKN